MRATPYRLAALGVLIACLLGLASFASASPRSRAASAATTIQTTQVITTFVPAGKPGVGTVWAGQAYHLDPKTGKRIGHGDAVCIQFTPGANGALDCQGDDHFAGGDIREAGIISNPQLLRWAIVGGTGAYAQASGTYEARSIGNSTSKSHVTFTIYGAAG